MHCRFTTSGGTHTPKSKLAIKFVRDLLKNVGWPSFPTPKYGLVEVQHHSFGVDQEESVFLSETVEGKWGVERPQAVLSSSRLYAWNTGERVGAYVVCALAVQPAQSKSSRVTHPISCGRVHGVSEELHR
jgi:hypothetical protein